jgi:hypothetical protein
VYARTAVYGRWVLFRDEVYTHEAMLLDCPVLLIAFVI